MNQIQRREYLIRFLLEESPEYCGMEIPIDERQQIHLLRSLFNIRPPKPIDSSFLEIQDAYLQEEIRAKGITDGNALPTVQGNPSISIWQGDITTLKVDAIVNAANSAMLGCFVPCHACIDNAIQTYSGIQLRLECAEIMEKQGHDEPTGGAKLTKAYNLPSRYVIHTVGPIIRGRLLPKDCDLLASCYNASLELAERSEISSIAFCCISTGEFHFPNDKAAEIAINTVTHFIAERQSKVKVIFNVFKKTDYEIYKRLLGTNK